jgi:HAE1 family hydrophobic/amphiphilic exporter-1
MLTIFGFALVIILLVLAAQFESFVSGDDHHGDRAARAGLRGVRAAASPAPRLNAYSQIGLVLLVGVMAKNGILIVEFANQLRDRGMARTRGDRGSRRTSACGR